MNESPFSRMVPTWWLSKARPIRYARTPRWMVAAAAWRVAFSRRKAATFSLCRRTRMPRSIACSLAIIRTAANLRSLSSRSSARRLLRRWARQPRCVISVAASTARSCSATRYRRSSRAYVNVPSASETEVPYSSIASCGPRVLGTTPHSADWTPEFISSCVAICLPCSASPHPICRASAFSIASACLSRTSPSSPVVAFRSSF